MNDNIITLLLIVSCGILLMLVGFFILFHKSQTKIAEQQRRLQEEQILHQKALIHAAIASQDAERKRIGRDLHDEIGTALSVLRLQIDQFQATTDPQALRTVAESYKRKIDRILNSCRNISHNLSPEIFTLNTLSESIDELCESVENTLQVQLDGDAVAWAILDTFAEDQAIHIYRILEEVIHNTVKHAQASCIRITCTADREQIHICYTDNGRGIVAERGKTGHGLKHIESRLMVLNALLYPHEAHLTGYQLRFSLRLPIEHTITTSPVTKTNYGPIHFGKF